MIEFKKRVKQCKLEKENAKKQDQLYPPCNIAWSEEDGTRVWCTKTRYLIHFSLSLNKFI